MLENMNETDLELLMRYARQQSEDAFTEIVRRHLALVFSAALRQVRSPQLAEEIAQCVFIELARRSLRLKPDTVLAAWLYQVTRRKVVDVARRETSRQQRERIATEMNATNADSVDWANIEPLLDEAMGELGEIDRTAVLLRYFENKSLREVGGALGVSENAAQKRLTRALDDLREFFSRRDVTVREGGLISVIATNAVQAAPAALVGTISTAATLAGTSLKTCATTAATKAIAMTTLQKTLIGATLAVAVGTGLYEARQTAHLKQENRLLRNSLAPLALQIQQLENERDAAARQLDVLRGDNERLNLGTVEVPRLRGEIASLRRQLHENQRLRRPDGSPPESILASENPVSKESAHDIVKPDFYPPELWGDKGLASPQNSSLTFLGALRYGDAEQYSASLGKTNVQKLPIEWANALIKVKGSHISETQISADGLPMVEIRHEMEDGVDTRTWLTFQKSGDEWRIKSIIGYPIAVVSAPRVESPDSRP